MKSGHNLKRWLRSRKDQTCPSSPSSTPSTSRTTSCIIGDVGTGKSTVTPIHEFELYKRERQIIIREPSRAACNALFYSLQALHPEVKHELAVITKDTKINVGGRIKIVTDGVLLRMLAENSVLDSSIYFDESHQMSSQLELCLSLAKKEEARAGNLFRVMSATIDPKEFLYFLGHLEALHAERPQVSASGWRWSWRRTSTTCSASLSLYLYTQPAGRVLAGLPPHEAPGGEVREQLRRRLHPRRPGGFGDQQDPGRGRSATRT